jgi:hypothetical protein
VSRRRLTTAITLVVLLFVLAGMALVGYRQLTAPLPAGPSASPTCNGPEKEVQGFIKRGEVQVSVFNASKRSGLAATTLDKVEQAGFVGGNAGNAPGSAKVRRAIVWTTEQDDVKAKLVATAFGPRTRIRVTKTDLGPGIDVLLGDKFEGMARKAPKRIKLPRPVETCVPVD